MDKRISWVRGLLFKPLKGKVNGASGWDAKPAKETAFMRYNFFSFLSLYPAMLLSDRILKTALEGLKSYLFLCLFIFSERRAFLDS
jgi:hypothetical protein